MHALILRVGVCDSKSYTRTLQSGSKFWHLAPEPIFLEVHG